ncbi:ras-associating and dilute domain-containing protein [Eudromia elegans]
MTTSRKMFYGSSSTMAPPSKNRLKRQSRIFSQVLYRTLSYKDRSSASSSSAANGDDPAELSTQLSAPGVLKIFGGNICAGTNYKSVLATGSSGARELVKEALERYGLSAADAGRFVLCDVVGRFEGAEKRWRTEGLRVLGDAEKPLLIQDLWKPREGFSRRLELRRRAEVEELAARDVDTTTAGINAQARRLQRHRAKGAAARPSERPGPPPSLRRSLSESSLGRAAPRRDDPLRRHCSTLPEALRGAAPPAAMRFSLYQSPHLLLLQGYSEQHDSLVYLLNREQHTVGQHTAASSPGIALCAPDILPLHCTLRRLPGGRRHPHERLLLEPGAGAAVAVNFCAAAGPVPLRHGDLLSLGLYYLLLYKDPGRAQPLPAQTLARLRALHRAATTATSAAVPGLCAGCGGRLAPRRPLPAPGGFGPAAPRRRPLLLQFERAAEDALLGRILSLIEPAGDDHKLTPAFLLCLCVQHAATAFAPGDFGQLLLKAARRIQRTVREKTQELAEKQAQHQDPASLSRLTISDLLPDLQHILFWMSNSIEILYFVQQKSPTYLQSMEEELDIKGSKESLFSSTITASEEAMAVLEEVIMHTFQQGVYYISKCLYVALPALLECDAPEQEGRAAPALPDELRRVVLLYQAAAELLRQHDVHPEVASQMFAYLFFFSNTLLFNQLLEKGCSLGCFQRGRGGRLRACVRLLLEWLRGAGFEQLARQFFAKLLSAAELLALPGAQLLQMSWPCLRGEFPALSPAQLRRLLSHCQAALDVGAVAAWQPDAEESAAALRHDEVLESFDNHPPIVLPTGGFKVDLDAETLDDNIYRHLLYIRHFLWSLRSKSPAGSDGMSPVPTKHEAPGTTHVPEVPESPIPTLGGTSGCAELDEGPGSSEEPLQEKLQQLQLGRSAAPTDPSCLLTPPTTPLNFEPGSPEPPPGTGLPEPRRNGPNGTRGGSPEGSGCSPTPYDYPTPASSSHSSATDDFCYVFVVELERGPLGLGMGLIDGLHTPLCSPGIYIRTLVPRSPAAADGRLCLGDRILAVNGTSLIGADYQSAVDLIRSGGKKLRFLVAKSDAEIANKISSSASPSS